MTHTHQLRCQACQAAVDVSRDLITLPWIERSLVPANVSFVTNQHARGHVWFSVGPLTSKLRCQAVSGTGQAAIQGRCRCPQLLRMIKGRLSSVTAGAGCIRILISDIYRRSNAPRIQNCIREAWFGDFTSPVQAPGSPA